MFKPILFWHLGCTIYKLRYRTKSSDKRIEIKRDLKLVHEILMSKYLMRVTFKQLFLALGITLFCLASTKAFSEPNTELTPSEKDALAELGLTLEDLNADLGRRAPAELTPPTPAPAPKTTLEEMISDANEAISDAFFPSEEKNVTPAKAGIQKSQDKKPAGESIHDLTPPKPSDEGKSQVRYDSEKQKKNVLAETFHADPLTRQHRMELQEKADTHPKNSTSSRVQSTRDLFIPKPVEPKKEEPTQITLGPVSLPEQNLVNQLKEYENIVKNKDLTQQQTQNLLDEYKKLLNLPQKEVAPTTPSSHSGFPGGSFTREQELALESLSRLINDENLQKQKPELVYNDIIKGLLVPKMDDAAKNLDLPIYSKVGESMVYVHDYKDPKDSTKDVTIPVIYKEEHKKRDKELSNKITQLLEDIDESIIDGVSSDLFGTVAKLEKASQFLENDILTTARLRQTDPHWLWERFKNDDGILTEDERFSAVQIIAELMEEGTISPTPEEKKKMMAFVEEYLRKFEEKSTTLASEEKECKDKESLEKDKERLERALESFRAVASRLSSTHAQASRSNMADMERLDRLANIVRRVRERLIASLKNMPDHDSPNCVLTKKGIAFCGNILDTIQATQSLLQSSPLETQREKISSEHAPQKDTSNDRSDFFKK